MFLDRFTEDARLAVASARQEAANIGSPHIEAEHLLLGIARAIEPDLKEPLRLKDVEDALRSDLTANAKSESPETAADLRLSNPCKRILAYAAEEAVRLNSSGIDSGHLLLGILRESDSIASRLLSTHNVDLARARQIVANMRTHEHTGRSSGSIGLANQIKRLYWIGIAVQLTLIVLLGVVVANSTITGRRLIVIAAVWFLSALAWMTLGRSNTFFLGFGKQNRAKIGAIYALGWLYQVFMFGWLVPLSIGVYRVM